MSLCGHYEGGDHCGVLSERRYLTGWRCPLHTPAALSGRPETVPDPDRTVEALARRDRRSIIQGGRHGTPDS